MSVPSCAAAQRRRRCAAAGAGGAGRRRGGFPDIPVTGVTLRGQDVRPGDLFAALPGASTHGARYAGDAIERGAVAVLTDAAGLAEMGTPARVPIAGASRTRAAVLGEAGRHRLR